MSTIEYSLPLQQPIHWTSPDHTVQTHLPPANDTARIVFTRQLWQRNMHNESQTEQGVLNKSHIATSQADQNHATISCRRTSSISLRSRDRSPSPSHGSKTPLTPEESPPFKTTRKRSAGAVEQEERSLDSTDTSPAHTRANSGDSAAHICLCQPDPKIPRPRNAFILYRQHHQANVVAQNPGLANPEISKIIGEQWQNQPPEVKNKWKSLAEEEKLRHQQQYPTYRYQPKRNGGRPNSLPSEQPGSAREKPRCQKCGGRTILTPSALFSGPNSSSVPPTPSTSGTPVTRTLPIFQDLSLHSPATRRPGRQHSTNMSPNHHRQYDERDDLGPLSPDNKRRRFNADQGTTFHRAMPPRYGVTPLGAAVGPGTPFPFGQIPPPSQSYPPSASLRRESLPGVRGMVNPPGQMAPPPPRPGMGYQQHRLSQGHMVHDRSLTLPPLQTGHQESPGAALVGSKTAEEQIMNMGFRYKVKVLSQVAPPAVKSREMARGPLIAIEGDTPDAANKMAEWLRDLLNNGEDLAARLLDGPELSPSGSKEEVMAQYHRLAADWLERSKSILESISMRSIENVSADAAMPDAVSSHSPQSNRKIDENYDDEFAKDNNAEENQDGITTQAQRSRSGSADSMDVDRKQKRCSTAPSNDCTRIKSAKLVSIIPNYSLHTSNVIACLVPLGAHDPYSPNDHWQWTATQWRGIIGPDLTIYVRDTLAGETGRPPVEIECVDGRPDIGLFIVRRTRNEGQEGGGEANDSTMQVEASVQRRLGFEVSEWVRAFGTMSGGE